jgi:leader peptidase (prepilin peptidase)/N-methyltransferase
VGFAAARGRCRHCAAPIPLWHLATEVFGLLALPVMIDIFGVLPGVVLFALGLVLIASSVSDFESQILPDGLILMTAVCALAMALIEGRNHLLVGIVSAALTAVVLELLRRFIRTRSGQPGLGLGDVKLAAALAIWLGVQIPLVMAVASGLGTAVILVGGRTFERIAFGPYISVSAFTIGVVELVIQGDPWLALK